MSDLIGRADAIDVIMGEPTDAHYPSWYADRIKALPSADTVATFRTGQTYGKSTSIRELVEVVRCKDCKHRHEDECPMYWEEQIDIDEGDGYYDTDYIIHDYTQDDGYCNWGERREP